jgi:hypothetical protein
MAYNFHASQTSIALKETSLPHSSLERLTKLESRVQYVYDHLHLATLLAQEEPGSDQVREQTLSDASNLNESANAETTARIALRLDFLEATFSTLTKELENNQLRMGDLLHISDQTVGKVTQLEAQYARVYERSVVDSNRLNEQAGTLRNQGTQLETLTEDSRAHAININYLKARNLYLAGWVKSRFTIMEKSLGGLRRGQDIQSIRFPHSC